MLQDYYKKSGWLTKFLIKLGLVYGGILLTLFVFYRTSYINLAPSVAIFAVILFIAEMHSVLHLFGFFYSLWPRKYKSYDVENKDKNLQINMWITCAGEPLEILAETIIHAKIAANKYFKSVKPINIPRVIVLNDAKSRGKENWKLVESLCNKLNVYHIARDVNIGFKAGNINNGLKHFPSTDPDNTIDCFFDTDFCAKEDFLIEILKPISDKTVDFVQSPQRYKSYDTWVAKAASAHQIFFFDYICPAKAQDNALFLCGTNYAIRRSALMAVGGFDTESITEDYATSISLHLAGKKGVFLSKVLALGLAPMSLKEYFSQQGRWSKGSFDTNIRLFKKLFFGNLSVKQKFHYFLSATYYLIGIRDLILMLAPIPYLLFGVSLLRSNSLSYIMLIYAPLLIYNTLLYAFLFKNPLKSMVLDIVSFPVFTFSFISSILKKQLGFVVTIKKYEKENPFEVYKVQLAVALILLSGLIYGIFASNRSASYGSFVNYFWALFDCFFLFLGFFLVTLENISVKVSYDFKIPTIPNFAIKLAKVALVVIISLFVGLSAPIAFNALGKEPQMRLADKYAQATEALTNFGKTEVLEIPDSGAYYGYYLPELNAHPENPNVNVISSDHPSLAMYYQDWNQESLFDIEFMKRLDKSGVIPVVTWEPMDTINLDSELNKKGAPEHLISNGNYDNYIRAWAKYAKSYKKPFFLRFAHEMNSNWYPWADSSKDGFENYKAMWIHVHNIFAEEGATNVIWVWTPNNTNEFGITAGILDAYPGDDYVDWVGYSAFNWGDSNWKKSLWRSFDFMSYDIYSELGKLDKPIMVAETSSVSGGGDKTGWFNDTLVTFIPKMSKIKAVVIFNQNVDEADFSLDSGIAPYFAIQEDIVDNGYYLKAPLLNFK